MRPTNQFLHSLTYTYYCEVETLTKMRDELEHHSHNTRKLTKVDKFQFLSEYNYSGDHIEIDFNISVQQPDPNLKLTFKIPSWSQKSIRAAKILLAETLGNDRLRSLKDPILSGLSIDSIFDAPLFPKSVLLGLGDEYYPANEDFFPSKVHLTKLQKINVRITEGLKKHDEKTKIRITLDALIRPKKSFITDAYRIFNAMKFYALPYENLGLSPSLIQRAYTRGLRKVIANKPLITQKTVSTIKSADKLNAEVATLSQWKTLLKATQKIDRIID